MRSTEKCLYKCEGPYTVGAEVDGAFKSIGTESVKRKAIQRAKSSGYTSVVVKDRRGEIVYECKDSLDVLMTHKQLRGYLYLLKSSEVPMDLVGSIVTRMRRTLPRETVIQKASWTDVEDEALRILYSQLGILDAAYLGGILGRSASAVSHRILRLKLKPQSQKSREVIFGLKRS